MSLSGELEKLLLRELLATYKPLVSTFFRGQLQTPVIELRETRRILGAWEAQTRTLAISREFVLSHPWGAVVEVLKHEMAHQYVTEVLKETGETAHGPAFRAACKRMGVDARARGIPQAEDDGTSTERTRIVERVARLLALAESPNVHEAEAAAAAAQRMMLKYNIEASKTDAFERDYKFRHLGVPTGRVTEHERILAMILQKHFFVEVIWVPVYRPREGKRGSVIEICGTGENLAMAEYVHGFLSHAGERLWQDHKKAQGLTGDRDRRVYLSGVMAGFAEKLAEQSRVHQKAGLVWVKDAALHGYLRARHPHIRHVRHSGTRKNDAFSHGKSAGRSLTLKRGMTSPRSPAENGAPRLLPSPLR